jgi:predicted dehydrogenase
MALPNGTSSPPTLRWGIIATGLISSWFVSDLLLPRPDAKAHHVLQAVGSSSIEKGKTFVQKNAPTATPSIYGSYVEVYADPLVDIVYIGTPHAFHAQNCLDAIVAGKHVLCEKAFALTARETQEVLSAAQEKGIFIMEAMWTRFNPLVLSLRKLLHEDKIIGDVRRTFCDFGLEMNIANLGPESRLKNPALGAGSLLDIGIYSLTWGLLTLDAGTGETAEEPKIVAAQTLSHSIDVTTSMILQYPKSGR